MKFYLRKKIVFHILYLGGVSLRKYHVNQLVRVRNREDINKTLDKDGKCEGCFFMNQMYTFCGREFIILKVLSNYWYGLMFKTRPGLYILEGLHCDGVVEGFDQTCDGACLLIWHEKWLEKAD